MNRRINKCWLWLLLATIATVIMLGTSPAFGQTTKLNKFGTRDPRTCDDTKAPARGAITSALALKYFICQGERVSGGYLYLIENPKLEVGIGRAYVPGTNYGDTDVDAKVPIYSIRGSYTSYQCTEAYSTPGSPLYNLGQNCNVTEYRQAKGECHKTTFGDWRCTMVDGTVANEDYRTGVPPPRGAAAADTPVKDKSTVKNDNQTTDKQADTGENGFVKPDFSEMEKYFEVGRLEYDFTGNRFFLLVKMTKKTNVCTWFLTFYDADGIKVRESNFVGETCDPELGEPMKIKAYTPDEREMKRVKRIVISRKFD